MKAVFLAFLLLFPFPATAVSPDEMLQDAALEARAREIGRQLRCLVCQGESIDESAAPLAADLRKIVRERLAAGDTDEKVIAFVHDRYGDRVLMKPPLKASTLFLWGFPFFALVLGIAVALRLSRKGGS